MNRRIFPLGRFLVIQAIVVAVFAAAYAVMPAESNLKLMGLLTGTPVHALVDIERERPLSIAPLYDDPEVVSDEELAAVLKQIRPRFPANELRPNHIEHALRTWGIDATFDDPEVMSGVEMRDFLIDHGKYLASWGDETQPLLLDRPEGVAIRWGREKGASVHHDHWLACLSEAGIPLGERVFTATRAMTIHDVVQEALRDFRYDERETEWSAMAFGLWLPPTKTWKCGDGRDMSFDMLARRQLRGHKRFGVCGGTHRVYSMMLLLRLDDDFDILSQPVQDEVYDFLTNVRDLISASQYDDGHWSSDWTAGAEALKSPDDEEEKWKVITTGHHLEWLAIAPEELHPPREKILQAADWIIKHTIEQTQEGIRRNYTFYSHVGNALALWRGTRAADFWRQWQKTHPFEDEQRDEKAGAADTDENAEDASKDSDEP